MTLHIRLRGESHLWTGRPSPQRGAPPGPSPEGTLEGTSRCTWAGGEVLAFNASGSPVGRTSAEALPPSGKRQEAKQSLAAHASPPRVSVPESSLPVPHPAGGPLKRLPELLVAKGRAHGGRKKGLELSKGGGGEGSAARKDTRSGRRGPVVAGCSRVRSDDKAPPPPAGSWLPEPWWGRGGRGGEP